MQSYMVRWVAAHKYGEVDTWTPEVKTKSVGVYQ
jgi:hypothetical protein